MRSSCSSSLRHRKVSQPLLAVQHTVKGLALPHDSNTDQDHSDMGVGRQMSVTQCLYCQLAHLAGGLCLPSCLWHLHGLPQPAADCQPPHLHSSAGVCDPTAYVTWLTTERNISIIKFYTPMSIKCTTSRNMTMSCGIEDHHPRVHRTRTGFKQTQLTVNDVKSFHLSDITAPAENCFTASPVLH